MKTGETATIQTTLAEITPKLLKSMLMEYQQESDMVTGHNKFVSRDMLQYGDYQEDFAFAGKRIDGTPMSSSSRSALCTAGFSAMAKNKTVSSPVTSDASLQTKGTSSLYDIISGIIKEGSNIGYSDNHQTLRLQ